MNKSFLFTMLALPLAVSSAFGQESTGISPVRISGFGTGALTWADTDRAQFGRSNQASGATTNTTTGVDSNLGLQGDLSVNDWLSVTAQGLVRKDAEDDFGAELAWAFVKVKLSNEVSVRAGRMGLPIFMISDYRNVGYANTMVRPPIEMYSQVPFNSIDGVDITWQHAFGATSLTTQLAAGQTDVKLAGGYDLEQRSTVALNVVAEHGPFTLRFGRAQGKNTVNAAALTTLVGGLRAAAAYGYPQLTTLAAEIEPKNKFGSFTSLGLGLDWNNIVIQSEVAKRKSSSYINDTTSWYAMGGYRIGKFLPFYSHASVRIDSAVVNTVPAACAAGAPAACTPTMKALGAGVSSVRNTGNGQGEQSTDTIGVRWDIYRSVALKAQVDRIKPKNGHGLFLHPTAGFTGPVTVGTLAVDFVF